jgi:structure-specific recognition protein 1
MAALDNEELPSSDDEVPAQGVRGSADEDEESVDEDFQADSESDVAEEYDSAHESAGSGDEDVEMEDASGGEGEVELEERPKKKTKTADK